jgi:UDP-N-acetylglucosamine 4,6-dehydratase/5-epimerase
MHHTLMSTKITIRFLPTIYNCSSDQERNKGGVKVNDNFCYSSEVNKEWLSVDDLKQWIYIDTNKIGKI